MRQLLILAIETPEPLDVDHLSLHVPRIIQTARGYGTILSDTFTPAQIKEAAKVCVAKVAEAQNVPIHPEMTRGDYMTMGLRLLADLAPMLDDIDSMGKR